MFGASKPVVSTLTLTRYFSGCVALEQVRLDRLATETGQQLVALVGRRLAADESALDAVLLLKHALDVLRHA